MSNVYERSNAMTKLRMRDGRRWTLIYREKAWEAALEDARRKSFFGAIFYGCMQMVELMAHGRAAKETRWAHI